MNWVNTCIKNRLVIYIAAIALCLAGLFCLYAVPITPFQPVSVNHIFINFSYSGASADTVQTQITTKIVNALKGTNNIEQIDANSAYGSAQINLTLHSNNSAELLQTQIKIMQAISASHLPIAVPQPEVTVAAGTSGLITFVLSSDKLSLFDLENFIQSTLYPKFSTFPGVSLFSSGQNAAVKIKLIPEKLAKYSLSAFSVYQIINGSYRANPLGNLYLNNQTYTLSINNEINSLQQLGDLVVGYSGQSGSPVFLKDIAIVSFGPKSVVSSSHQIFNGHTAEGISLYTRALANPFLISKMSKAYIQKLKKNLPSTIKITSIFDQANTMRTSIREVMWTILIASILVLLVVLMFLGHLRTTLIPIATIPICLLGSVVAINLLGYSINLITLLALVLAVGLVVDDAIVVIENITRYLEQGMKKYEAVLHGTSNIALTIIGITFTLLAVYLPVVFCSGMFITFLKAFSIPLAAAVFVSGIVALTLTPVMSLFLISDHKANAYQIKFNSILKFIIKWYQLFLKHVLKAPRFALVIIIILIIVSGYFALKVPKRFFPIDPDGTIHIILTNSGQDDIASLRQKAKQFKQFYSNNKVKYYAIDIDRDPMTDQLRAAIDIQYKYRYLHQIINIVDQINQYIKKYHLTSVTANVDKFSNAGSDVDLSVSLYGGSVDQVNQAARKLTKIMKISSMFMSVTNTINQPHKQIAFDINTVKAAKFGLFQPNIAQLLSTYYGGATLDNNFNIAGLSVPVIVRLNDKNLKNPQSIEQLQIKSPVTNKFYPLNEFVSLKTVAKPDMISTLNGKPSVAINATLAKGNPLSKAIDYTNLLMQKYTPSTQYLYTGNAKEYLEGNKQSIMITIFGIVAIYLLLTILFGSMLDPFIILFTVPFSVIGGAISLYLIGGSINLYSTLGLITLVGLITKHGVLIVRFANHELQKGASVYDAIITATHHRFRPIIMTTLVMCLGALPLLLSHGLMYVARRDLGIVIIGGLMIGTLFSLFIVPLIYLLVKRVPMT